MNIIIDPALISNTGHIEDLIGKAIEKYKNHPSIVKIKEVNGDTIRYSFKNFSVKEMIMEISKFSTSKSCRINRISAKIIKSNVTFFSNLMHGNLSNSISQGMFPDNLKLADITPGHKNGERQDKGNYRPVSILSPIS